MDPAVDGTSDGVVDVGTSVLPDSREKPAGNGKLIKRCEEMKSLTIRIYLATCCSHWNWLTHAALAGIHEYYPLLEAELQCSSDNHIYYLRLVHLTPAASRVIQSAFSNPS